MALVSTPTSTDLAFRVVGKPDTTQLIQFSLGFAKALGHTANYNLAHDASRKRAQFPTAHYRLRDVRKNATAEIGCIYTPKMASIARFLIKKALK